MAHRPPAAWLPGPTVRASRGQTGTGVRVWAHRPRGLGGHPLVAPWKALGPSTASTSARVVWWGLSSGGSLSLARPSLTHGVPVASIWHVGAQAAPNSSPEDWLQDRSILGASQVAAGRRSPGEPGSGPRCGEGQARRAASYVPRSICGCPGQLSRPLVQWLQGTWREWVGRGRGPGWGPPARDPARTRRRRRPQ